MLFMAMEEIRTEIMVRRIMDAIRPPQIRKPRIVFPGGSVG